ncbi:scarecrow-like protein 8 [Cinnamomum micranthum f. kanehirae]|uniref:Scarecrow-like protein 8 n=1 Tax=Cinnamomum micranthum f. kanehirae TaxID=337451 RepID=A0A3S3PFB2_9MAGN|nr:scarecrow-like protein 8 [Cinnamomum micranthum f. kanehirae]
MQITKANGHRAGKHFKRPVGVARENLLQKNLLKVYISLSKRPSIGRSRRGREAITLGFHREKKKPFFGDFARKAAMSSGYPGSDFYSHAGIGGAPAMNNSVRVQYRQQLGGILVDPSPSPAIPQHPILAKRPLTDFERQQQQAFFLLRSVKQRTHLTSPISPLSPIDLSSASPEISTTTSSVRLGASPFRHLQYQQQQPPPPPPPNNLNSCNFSFSPVPNRFSVSTSEPDSDKNIRNCLQELERQLLDDDEEDTSAVSAVTNSGWSETMQNLMTPKPNPTSPTSSSSSTTTTSASSSPPSSSSSKQLVFDSAGAISEGKTETAAGILTRLKQVSNPRSGDAEQRLAAYMVGALLSRINPAESGGGGQPIAELCSSEHMMATQMLYEASPCFKLGFMAANHAILDATENQQKIHIVDFDIGQGSQYLTLIHALAERQRIKPTVKITAINDPNSINGPNGLQVVSDRLTKLADRVGIVLRFNVLCMRASDLSRESIGCNPDESLAVNFAFRLYKMADESVSTANPRDELLRVVKGLHPVVVTLVEQEMNANTAPFLARFGESWAYCRALFESLDATVTRDRPQKFKFLIEECLARKAANSVAREGRDRVERCELFGKWRARMGMAGFQPRPLSGQIAESMRTRANQTHSGFFAKEESGGICFGWMGRILTVASSWR